MNSSLLSWSFLVPCAVLAVVFIITERRGVKLRELMPVVVMSAIASVGRVIFTFIPQVQPVTAVVIIMGMCYGAQSGFITGALTAFASNIFMGMGPWTVWQMCAWGLIGALSGVLSRVQFCKKIWFLVPYGALMGFFYSLIVDIWTVSTLGDGISLGMAVTTFTTGLVFNIPHAISNAVFILLLYKPLSKKFERIKMKYAVLA